MIATSVGHFMSTPPSSVGKVWVGKPSTAPPDSIPRMREHHAVLLERAIDVHCHRIGSVLPGVLGRVSAGSVFFEIEFIHRAGGRAVRQTRQRARHGQADVLGIFRFAQRAPCGVIGRGENLRQVARVGELAPVVHAHQLGRGRGNERCMRGSSHLRHAVEQFHIRRALVEIVIADQAAIRFATELAVFLLVDLLEDGALVPGGALVALEHLAQFLLADVQHADLELLVGLGVVDQIMQAAPGAFELLQIGVMQDGG